MNAIWKNLYDEAMKVLNPRKISEWMEAGGVAAAVESESGKIYTGVCVDSACTLGICAERNAIFNMITQGEQRIRRVIAVNWNGKAMPPCGACREFMMQLGSPENTEILVDSDTAVTLKDLMPYPY